MFESQIELQRMYLSTDKVQTLIQVLTRRLKKLILSHILNRSPSALRSKSLRKLPEIFLQALDLFRRNRQHKLFDGHPDIVDKLRVEIIFGYHELEEEICTVAA